MASNADENNETFQEVLMNINDDLESTDTTAETLTTLSRSTTILTEETLIRVLKRVEDDKILSLTISSKLEHLKTLNVADMVHRMIPMNECLSTKRLLPQAAKECVWKNYYTNQDTLVAAIDSLIHHHALSAFICLKTMQELIYQNYNQQSLKPSHISSCISRDEEDIISYVGGYALFRCKRILSKSESCFAIVEKTQTVTGESTKPTLISVKSRGGLCEPNSEMIVFFRSCELIFRQLFPSLYNLSLKLFTDTVCGEESVLSTFYSCTSSASLSEESQETVLLCILTVFFRTRCHAKCRQFFEKFLSSTKSNKKTKALRKQLLK